MSVAYDLDVTNLNSLSNFSNALVSAGKNNYTGELFQGVGKIRLRSPVDFGTDLFPTGEYIIRKGMYINGTFFLVGSYKAYCRNLFGTGNNGYAWDGFLIGLQGYNTTVLPPLQILYGLNDDFVFGAGSGFIPMRMMFEVNPGPIGSATAIANDSEVGLYGIDFYKSEEDFSILEFFSGDINLILCGFQRIDPTVEGVPTGSDYVGNIYMGQFLKYLEQREYAEGVTQAGYVAQNNNIMQITWKANVAGHSDRTLEPFGRAYDLNEWLGVIEEVSQSGGPIWNFQRWETPETKPDTEKVAVNCNVFPRRFYDITCKSTEPSGTFSIASSPFIIVGDSALDTNDDGAINKTVPMIIVGCYPFRAFMQNESGTFDQAPYLLMNPSGTTSKSISGSYQWVSVGGATLDGSVGVFCSLPYEATDITTPFDLEDLPATLIALNGVPNGGNTYGAIFALQESLLYEGQFIYAIAMEGGNMTTATGVQMPNKWYGKAVQQRTFTITEEDFSKQGVFNTETGEFTPNESPLGGQSDQPSIFDNDAKEYIGFNGNFQRYGAFTYDSLIADEVPNKKAGDLSGAGYGFLGIRDGVGAIAVMYDSGSPNLSPTLPLKISMVVRGEGANISANCITNPSSVSRKIIDCGWDNDRDQWLFIASDTNQVSVVSVSSDFTTDTNNIGFLDQTDNFSGIEANTDAAMYFPISMSNSLDGWVWFGEIDTDTENGLGIKPKNLGSAVSTTVTYGVGLTVTYDAYPNATTQVKRITGTTGRTASVWVDYILFDGADSIIANKIKERGMKVSIEAVEWFKRTIIQTGDLNITDEEIEMWMREQQDEYKQTLKENERQGRVRRKKKQVSAYTEGIEEQINPDFMDNEVKDYLGTFTPETRPPTPEEQRIERKKKGGYSPEQGSYYDEVFED
mgnify:CR=1 FL=1